MWSAGRVRRGERKLAQKGLVSVPSEGVCSDQNGSRLTGAQIMLELVSRS